VKVVQRAPPQVAGDGKEDELKDLFPIEIGDPLDSAGEFGMTIMKDFKTLGDDRWTAQHAVRAQAQSSMRFNKRFKGTKLSLKRPDFTKTKANTRRTQVAAQRTVAHVGRHQHSTSNARTHAEYGLTGCQGRAVHSINAGNSAFNRYQSIKNPCSPPVSQPHRFKLKPNWPKGQSQPATPAARAAKVTDYSFNNELMEQLQSEINEIQHLHFTRGRAEDEHSRQ
jgi:hypothetical protein